MPRHLPAAAWLAALLVIGFAVYAPGLDGPFVFDDRVNVTAAPSIAIESLDARELRDAMFVRGGFPDRGLARLSFALSYYFAGRAFDPLAFKLANVAIHLLAGVLVYLLAARLLRRRAPAGDAGAERRAGAIALLVAAVWLLHPIQLTAVLYVVQRMTSLAGLFVFAGLLAFVVGRERLERGARGALAWMLAGVGGGAALGFLCKENAALLPLLALVVEAFFFERATLGRGARRGLLAFYGLTVAAPLALAVAGAGVAWETIAQGYAHRAFGPGERLLTEARALWLYALLLLAPYPRWFGLFHDDLAVSAGWLEPWTTLPAVLAGCALVALAIRAARGRAMWAFAIAWFLVAHSMESTILALEPVFEHRNYVPSFGVALAIGHYAARVPVPGRTLAAALAAVVAALALATASRASTWSSAATLVEVGLRNHPGSARYHGEYAALLTARAGDPETIVRHWQRAARLDPTEVLGLVEMAKLLAGHAIALRVAGGGARDGGAARAPPDGVLSAPLRADAAYLEGFVDGLDAEIAARLRARAIATSTVAALDRLTRCVEGGAAPCAALAPRLGAWLEIAFANPRAQPGARAILAHRRGELLALRGETGAAAGWVERAAALDPDEVHFRIALVRLHLEAGEVERAAAALDAARAAAGALGRRAEELRALGREIEARRGAERPE